MKRNTLFTRIFLLLFVSLLFAACDSGPEAEDLEEPPTVYLLQNGERIGAYEGIFCWLEEEGDSFNPEDVGGIAEVCEDETVPAFDDADFVSLSAGEPIAVEVEEPLPDRMTLSLSRPDDVFLEQSRTDVAVSDAIVSWEAEDVEPGDYILIALGFWRDAGGAAYYFPVTVE